jgi:F-type H+-transporting ATPase subunit gamma
MATLREVRRRISSVQSTQKITKAMKMVATAKLRRAQTAAISSRPYAKKMQEMLQHLSAAASDHASDLLTGREVHSVAVVVVTADRGLCGGFNSNLIRTAGSFVEERYPGWMAQGRVKLFCVGKKGADFLTRRKFPVAQRYVGLFDRLSIPHAHAIAADLVGGYRKGEFDRVEIVYNQFKSMTRQEIVIEQFLPVPAQALKGGAGAARPPAVDYIYEPSKERLLEAVVPKHLNFQIWRVLLESNAAEQAARMTAMENATTNARDLIRELQLQYNKARQASITKELLEIVGGAEALTQAG